VRNALCVLRFGHCRVSRLVSAKSVLEGVCKFVGVGVLALLNGHLAIHGGLALSRVDHAPFVGHIGPSAVGLVKLFNELLLFRAKFLLERLNDFLQAYLAAASPSKKPGNLRAPVESEYIC